MMKTLNTGTTISCERENAETVEVWIRFPGTKAHECPDLYGIYKRGELRLDADVTPSFRRQIVAVAKAA